MHRIAALACVLTFHAPDGSELMVWSESIRAIRPIDQRHHDHVAHGIRSVLYGIVPTGFGVTETPQQALDMIRGCQ